MKNMTNLPTPILVWTILASLGASTNLAPAAVLFNADFDSIPVSQYDPATVAFNADTSMLPGSLWTIQEGAFAEIYVQSSNLDATKHAVNSDNSNGTTTRGLTANFAGSGGEFSGSEFIDIQFIWGRSRTGGATAQKEYYVRGETVGGASQVFSLNWDAGGTNGNDIVFNGTVIGKLGRFQGVNTLWDPTNFLLVDIHLQDGLADISIRNASDNSLLVSRSGLTLNSTGAIDQLEFGNVFTTGVSGVGFWVDNVNVVSGIIITEPSTLSLAGLVLIGLVAVWRLQKYQVPWS